jgi:hypothetical protein
VECESKSDTSNTNRGTTGTISESLRQYLNNTSRKHEIKGLQKTAILGTAYIRSLSKKFMQWVNGGVGCELVAYPSSSTHSTGPI